WEGHKFLWKLKSIKEKLKTWNMEVFGDVRVAKNSLCRRIKVLDALEGSISWNNQLRQERYAMKCELEELILKEERTLRLKSEFS
ncbi:hypothetical protein TorRG33x02_190700, partial [Trema orientale]